MFGLFKKKDNGIAKVGEIVKCIDDRVLFGNGKAPAVVYKKLYKVLDVYKCHECGTFAYDVGLRNNDGRYTHCCRNNYMPGITIHWAASIRFVRATPEEEKEYYSQEKEQIEEKIKIHIQNEEYEEANKLKNLIQ